MRVVVLDDALRLLEHTRQLLLDEERGRSEDTPRIPLSLESIESCITVLRQELKDAAVNIDDGDL